MDRSQESGAPYSPGDCAPLSDLLRLFTGAFDFTYLPLFNMDSSNMQPEHWQELARCIHEKYDDFDGFLVLHGTDTLSYSAAALSFMLHSIGKPVVLTGSQLPLRAPASDGHNNVINSLNLLEADPSGVYIVFGSQVIRGTRARKVSSFDFQAFVSVNEEPVATIGLKVRWRAGAIIRPKRGFKLMDRLEQRVALLKIHPGFSPEMLAGCIDSGYLGIMLESYGVGNVPDSFRALPPLIRRATDKGIVVLVVSQCVTGATDLTLYQAGQETLKAGAVSGRDMTPESALVKLMWALGNFPQKKVPEMLGKDICGELGR